MAASRTSLRLRGLAALGLWACLGCGSARGFDPVSMDPPPDPELPARLVDSVSLESGGARLNALLYQAAGAGPHPTVILLHGFPGVERNLDLAQAIRRAGWNVFFFHYRGAWGSGGEFSFAHVLEDVAAASRLLRNADFAAENRIDASRIALVGHSMGGFAALVSASELAEIRCVVSIAGANLGLWDRALTSPEQAAQLARTLDGWGRGPIRNLSGARLVAETRANAERFDTTRRAAVLATKPALLVAGARDQVTPPALHHDPLVAAIAARGGGQLRTTLFESDHAFSDHRIALSRRVVEFLEDDCAGP